MISVIMPAYNAENSISASVSSILNQSYRDIELIVVNDGSTDGTLSVLDSIAETDSRLRVISVVNGGPAKARNIGLKSLSPSCTHVMFCDSDDEFTSDSIALAVETSLSGADIVIMGFRIINPNGTQNDYCEPRGEYDRMSFGAAYPQLYKANLLNQAWGKLFSAKLLLENSIEFPDYRWGEDRLFMLSCLEHMSKVSVIPDIAYLYKMQTGESLISGFYDKKVQVCVEIDRRICSLKDRLGVEDDETFTYMFIKSIFSSFTNLYSPGCTLSDLERKQYVSDAVNDDYVMSRINDRCGNRAASVISDVIKTRDISIILTTAKLAVDVSRLLPNFFQKIKHKK